MDKNVDDWIISVCSSEGDGIDLYRLRGTPEEVKKAIVKFILIDKNEDLRRWENGTESTAEIENVTGRSSKFYGYGNYSNYHIDYTAVKYSDIEKIE